MSNHPAGPTVVAWYPVDGGPDHDHMVISNGAGDFLRLDRGGWGRVDATGQPIDGELPAEVRLNVDPDGGVFVLYPAGRPKDTPR